MLFIFLGEIYLTGKLFYLKIIDLICTQVYLFYVLLLLNSPVNLIFNACHGIFRNYTHDRPHNFRTSVIVITK